MEKIIKTACLYLIFMAAIILSSGCSENGEKSTEPLAVDSTSNGIENKIISTEAFGVIVQAKGVSISKKLALEPVKIAFATPLKQVSDYWRRSIDSFKGRMDEIGLPYTVTEFSTRSNESRKLKESVQLALQTKPHYLVVTPTDEGNKAVISRLLVNKNIKAIIQNTTLPKEEWQETPPFLYVGFDHTIGTEKIAEEYMQRFAGRNDVKYAVLYWVPGSEVSKLRGDFFNTVISERTTFKLMAEFYTDGSSEWAKKAALKVLKSHPDIDFIYACSTDVAFGALAALEQTGLEKKILVNGWGGGSSELDSILSGGLDFTVMRMNDDNGVAMAEAIRLDLEGKVPPLVYSGEMVTVTQNSQQADVDSLKRKAFRYSDN